MTVCFASTGPPVKPQPSTPPACCYEALSKCLCGLILHFSNGSVVLKRFFLQMSYKHYEMPSHSFVIGCNRKTQALVTNLGLLKHFLLSLLFHLKLLFYFLFSCCNFPEPTSGVPCLSRGLVCTEHSPSVGQIKGVGKKKPRIHVLGEHKTKGMSRRSWHI